ncbi:MAG: extracellular catalytic domain type 1 short-chain-length polyhydroxyalkanoate depolymerase [Burkholderiales bacterium]
MKGVTDTIQQALSAAGLYTPAPNDADGSSVAARAHDAPVTTFRRGVTIDGVAREVATRQDITEVDPFEPATPAEPARPGQFVTRSFTNHAGTRTYKLYVPASYAAERDAVPMVVMLHGCTQSPDDFAAGTRMNVLAEQHGFLVVYPGQAANANGSKCWNWFRAEDQDRDRGEPSIIAGITREVAKNYRVDVRRIFVAGLSAGAAMAVILGATYPELYAAIGAHSGLPYRAAHDMPSAFGAMHGAGPLPGMPNLRVKPVTGGLPPVHQVPTIVFHGDSDHTVNAQNAATIVEHATAGRADRPRLRASVDEGAAGGRTYRRTVYAEADNRPVVEQWVLHGAGHAWSGGSSSGSFTDATGPDASAEMIRFFYSQPRAGTA